MATRDIIVVGASTGGVDTLARLARGFPPGLPAQVFVVCHFPPGGRSVLPEILSGSGPLPATHAEDGEPFFPGRVYVAPPDRHLLLGPGNRLRVTRDARENHHRPAADPLFRSAARYYGERVIGVVLTGALFDGTAGLMAIRAAGGLAVVQDPSDAVLADMPRSATEVAGADHVVPAADLAELLVELVGRPTGPAARDRTMSPAPVDPVDRMPDTVERDMTDQIRGRRRGDVSVLTCPECGGSLWQVDETGLVRFRCHVGHVYNGEALLNEQGEALEAALWTAVRTFREKSVLGRQLAARARAEGNPEAAARFDDQAELSDRYGRLITKHVLNGEPTDRPDGSRA